VAGAGSFNGAIGGKSRVPVVVLGVAAAGEDNGSGLVNTVILTCGRVDLGTAGVWRTRGVTGSIMGGGRGTPRVELEEGKTREATDASPSATVGALQVAGKLAGSTKSKRGAGAYIGIVAAGVVRGSSVIGLAWGGPATAMTDVS
jgi:hypothetical protein